MLKTIVLTHPSGKLQSVKIGFCWPAFFFGCLWALVKRMWGLALILIGISLALNIIEGYFFHAKTRSNATYNLVIVLMTSLVCGFYGNRWRQSFLEKKGYVVTFRSTDTEFKLAPSVVSSTGASAQTLTALKEKYPTLPDDYIRFLTQTNGAEGSLGFMPGWLYIWSADDVLVTSDQYELSKQIPGHIAFGDNGDGDLFLFSTSKTADKYAVYQVPEVGMAFEKIVQVAPSFSDFVAAMGKDDFEVA